MTHDDQVKYLANIFNIAAVDGTVGAAESRLLKSIIRRIGATTAAVEAARQMVIRGNYSLQALTAPEDRTDNIEAMVMVALVDGELTEKETGPIESISDLMQLSQQQMDAIVQRAQHRLAHPEEESQRPRRATPPVPPNAKTPPAPPKQPKAAQPKPPRTAVRPVRPVQVEEPVPSTYASRKPAPPPKPPAFEVPDAGLILHFSGVMPERAQTMLGEITGAEKTGEYREDQRTWYYAVWNVAQMASAVSLALKTYSLTNRRVHLNGKPVEWNDLFAFCPCTATRTMSDTPEAYCFGAGEESINIWGCKMAGMDWSDRADWFALGEFIDDNTFVFDKAKISRKLEAHMKAFCHCPFVNEELMQAALNRLPRQARVTGKWKLREADPSNMQAAVKTIRESIHGCVMEYDGPVDGMAPTDWREGIRLIATAARDSGLTDLDTKAIVPLGAY